MTLVRWQPIRTHNHWGRLNMLENRLNSMFDESIDADHEPVTWSPRIDLIEHEDRFELLAELPGLEKENVKLELKNNQLSISGEKVNVFDKQDHHLHLTERRYGRFERKFQLPAILDTEQISADFVDGLLLVKLPKQEETKPKAIEISTH